MKQIIKNFLKGMTIGSSMLLPGVSGGSMAIILGVYDQLITAVSTLRKQFKEQFFFLLTYALGGAAGLLIFARALLYITETYEKPMLFLFIGAVLGSIPMLVKKADLQKGSSGRIYLAYILIGFLSVYLLRFLPENLLSLSNTLSTGEFMLLFLLGILLSIALVLPGISFSYMLLVLGLYKPALTAIEQLQLPFILTLGTGILSGIFLTTKILDYLMKRHPSDTFLIITGFVLGSLLEIFPGFPTNGLIFICLLTFGAGFTSILLLSKHTK